MQTKVAVYQETSIIPFLKNSGVAFVACLLFIIGYGFSGEGMGDNLFYSLAELLLWSCYLLLFTFSLTGLTTIIQRIVGCSNGVDEKAMVAATASALAISFLFLGTELGQENILKILVASHVTTFVYTFATKLKQKALPAIAFLSIVLLFLYVPAIIYMAGIFQ